MPWPWPSSYKSIALNFLVKASYCHSNRIEWNNFTFISSLTDRCQSNQVIQNSHLVPWFWLIQVMFTLHFKWTSIGSLGWIALPPCKAFILWRGCVEKYSFSSWFELRIVPVAHRIHILFHYGLWTFLSCSIRRSSPSLHEHEVPFWFITKAMLMLDFSEIFCCAKSLWVVRSS